MIAITETFLERRAISKRRAGGYLSFFLSFFLNKKKIVRFRNGEKKIAKVSQSGSRLHITFIFEIIPTEKKSYLT